MPLLNHLKLSNYSKQQIFDHIASHLLTQARLCLTPEGACAMLNAENYDRCAAGCLLPVDVLKKSLEDPAAPSLAAGWISWKRYLGMESIVHNEIIMHLQNVHDAGKSYLIYELDLERSTYDPSLLTSPDTKDTLQGYWMDKLRKVARLHDLSSKVVDRFAGDD